MDDTAVSAFAAYAVKKSKEKSKPREFKIKTKHKLKKNKFKDHSINSKVIKLLKEGTESNNSKPVEKKKRKEKKRIQANHETSAPSFFENCSLTSEMDNVFLNGNTFSDNSEVGDKLNTPAHSKMQVKKLKKKKKIRNGEGQPIINDNTVVNKNSNAVTEQSFTPVTHNSFDKSSKDEVTSTTRQVKGVEGKYKNLELIYSDSTKIGEEIFMWLLSPVEMEDFFKNCWEQKPLHITHSNETYFKCICTMDDFKAALSKHDMYFTRNIDVTSYVNGVRKTENPEGKAKPAMVWDFYRKGRSIRLLNPQTFIPNIWMLNSFLQEFFQCFVGSNIYLTPPGTQGFAPHYDDIEAFVLQLEGEKHWKLYNPRTPDEVLPRESSKNFTEDELGDPILEVTLRAGDLLYFPRGIIHQAKCLPHVHSLHITVSCYQKNSWADLLERVLPVALQRAISENVEFRKGLPIGYLNHLGMLYSDEKSEQRLNLIKQFEQLTRKVLEYCPLDAAVDQLGADFMHDALPPHLTGADKLYGGDRENKDTDKCLFDALRTFSNRNLGIKLIRANCLRLVTEQEELILYYTTDNSLVYHEQERACINVPTRWAQAIDQLIHWYPKFLEMKELVVFDKTDQPGKRRHKAEFVYFFWQKGLLLFDRPLRQLFSC